MFTVGDWVVFDNGYKKEVGRVASLSDSGNVFVCYHEGCTAACTDSSMLRLYDYDKDKDLTLNGRIGYHRFDSDCPDYNPEYCYMCRIHSLKQGK